MGWERGMVGVGAAALAIASCGGGGEPASSEVSETESEPSASTLVDNATFDVIPAEVLVLKLFDDGPVHDTAEDLREAHGPVGGFAAALVSLDSGYTAAQLMSGSVLAADGTIEGVAPEGSPLGLLAPSDGPQGFRAAPRQPGIPADRLLTLYDLTVGQAHEQANQAALDELDDQFRRDVESAIGGSLDDLTPDEVNARVEAAREQHKAELAAERERREGLDNVTVLMLTMLGGGYSLEQTVEALIFGDFKVSAVGGPCLYMLTPPAGDPLEGFEGCGIVVLGDSGESDAVDEADAAEPVADDQAPQSEFDEDRPRGLYNATIVEFLDPDGEAPSSVMANLVTIDLSGETPEIAVSYGARLAPDNYDNDADVVCQMDLFIEVPRTKLADAVLVGDKWSGELEFEIGGFDGTCSAGSQDNEMLGPGTFTVAFVATESTVSGTLEAAGDVLSFDGTVAS